MSQIEDEPAFPNGQDVTLNLCAPSPGMSLRDYFAAKAMQSIIAGENWLSCSDLPLAANIAYKMADAMLKERKK